MRLTFILIFVSSIIFGQIQNKILFTKVLDQLNLNENMVNTDLAVDKVLPYSKDKTAFVIPKYKNDENDDNYNEYDSFIVIVENKSGKILNKFHEEHAWTSDAISLTKIDIDTGMYLLNEKNRAFGVRVHYEGSSRPNPYNKTDLSLYITENDQLKRILKDFVVNEFIGEWDTNCSGEFEETKSTIDLSKTKNNGLYNLMVKQRIKKIQNIPTKDDCTEKSKTEIQSKVLKFDGEKYQ